MPSAHLTSETLAPELEAIAQAANVRLRAQANETATAAAEAQRRVAEAASAAMTAGTPLGVIADAERVGEQRARHQLSRDVLRAAARAANSKRDADTAYEQAIRRVGLLGLSHREIAAEAQVTHGTIRAILTREPPPANTNGAPASTVSDNRADGEHVLAEPHT